MRDQEQIVVDNFKGLWDRDDNYPLGYGLNYRNVRFDNNAVFTRENIGINFALSGLALAGTDRVIGHWPYRPSTAPFTQRYIVLVQNTTNTNGRFFDTGKGVPSTPILSIGTVTSASVIQLYDRIFISPRLAGQVVYVYDTLFSPQVARAIAGIAPTTVPAAAIGAAGNCEPGLHLVSVAFETNTGFITKPARLAGVSLATQITVASGTPSIINLTAVPTGPAGTAKRHILYTKVVPRYDGNPENYRFYFAGVINDNVTTTFALNLFDSQLLSSSDYLYKLKESVEQCNSLSVHDGRLLSCGPSDDIYLVRVSRNGDPESFSDTDGYCIVGKGDGGRVQTAKSFRGNINVWKGRRTYAIQPTDGAPSTWPIVTIDVGKGCGPDGIGEIVDAPSGANQEGLIIAALDGLWFFDGSYSAMPLSWVIEKGWASRISKSSRHFLVVDPISCRIFIVLGPIYSGSGGADKMYVCDFSEGLTFDKVKWADYTNAVGGLPSSMHVEPISVGGVETSQLSFTQYSNITNILSNILDKSVGTNDISSTDITWDVTLGNFSFPGMEMSTFLAVRLRGKGSSKFNFSAIGASNLQYSDTDWTLGDEFTNYDYTRKHINLVTERVDVLGFINNGTGTNSSMTMQELIIYGKPTWNRT